MSARKKKGTKKEKRRINKLKFLRERFFQIDANPNKADRKTYKALKYSLNLLIRYM